MLLAFLCVTLKHLNSIVVWVLVSFLFLNCVLDFWWELVIFLLNLIVHILFEVNNFPKVGWSKETNMLSKLVPRHELVASITLQLYKIALVLEVGLALLNWAKFDRAMWTDLLPFWALGSHVVEEIRDAIDLVWHDNIAEVLVSWLDGGHKIFVFDGVVVYLFTAVKKGLLSELFKHNFAWERLDLKVLCLAWFNRTNFWASLFLDLGMTLLADDIATSWAFCELKRDLGALYTFKTSD